MDRRVKRVVQGIMEETLDDEAILSELEELVRERPWLEQRAARIREALGHSEESGVTAMLQSQARALEQEWEERNQG